MDIIFVIITVIFLWVIISKLWLPILGFVSPNKAQMYMLGMGIKCLEEHKPKEAVAIFSHILKVQPNDTENEKIYCTAALNAGLAYVALGDLNNTNMCLMILESHNAPNKMVDELNIQINNIDNYAEMSNNIKDSEDKQRWELMKSLCLDFLKAFWCNLLSKKLISNDYVDKAIIEATYLGMSLVELENIEADWKNYICSQFDLFDNISDIIHGKDDLLSDNLKLNIQISHSLELVRDTYNLRFDEYKSILNKDYPEFHNISAAFIDHINITTINTKDTIDIVKAISNELTWFMVLIIETLECETGRGLHHPLLF